MLSLFNNKILLFQSKKRFGRQCNFPLLLVLFCLFNYFSVTTKFHLRESVNHNSACKHHESTRVTNGFLLPTLFTEATHNSFFCTLSSKQAVIRIFQMSGSFLCNAWLLWSTWYNIIYIIDVLSSVRQRTCILLNRDRHWTSRFQRFQATCAPQSSSTQYFLPTFLTTLVRDILLSLHEIFQNPPCVISLPITFSKIVSCNAYC